MMIIFKNYFLHKLFERVFVARLNFNIIVLDLCNQGLTFLEQIFIFNKLKRPNLSTKSVSQDLSHKWWHRFIIFDSLLILALLYYFSCGPSDILPLVNVKHCNFRKAALKSGKILWLHVFELIHETDVKGITIAVILFLFNVLSQLS